MFESGFSLIFYKHLNLKKSTLLKIESELQMKTKKNDKDETPLPAMQWTNTFLFSFLNDSINSNVSSKYMDISKSVESRASILKKNNDVPISHEKYEKLWVKKHYICIQ